MQNPLLASRYAKSLLDLAIEFNAVEPVLKDVEHIKAIIDCSPEFGHMLRSPILKADKKNSVLSAVFGDKLHDLTGRFIKLLVNKNREANLGEITSAFIKQYREANKIKAVKITATAPMAQEVIDTLTRRLHNEMPGYTFEMTTEVNPDLIGGFTLEMDDKLVDASIKRDLNDVKMQFLKNLYVNEIR